MPFRDPEIIPLEIDICKIRGTYKVEPIRSFKSSKNPNGI